MSVLISQFIAEIGVPSGSVVPPSGPRPVTTSVFDGEGLGNEWWIALQLTDSGDELRDKNIKPFRVTGKGSNRVAKFYRYGPEDDVDVSAIEAGTGFTVEADVPDAATHVERSARLGLNVPNAMTWTCRLQGEWDGTGIRDRVDEISIEVARQGIRR